MFDIGQFMIPVDFIPTWFLSLNRVKNRIDYESVPVYRR